MLKTGETHCCKRGKMSSKKIRRGRVHGSSDLHTRKKKLKKYLSEGLGGSSFKKDAAIVARERKKGSQKEKKNT